MASRTHDRRLRSGPGVGSPHAPVFGTEVVPGNAGGRSSHARPAVARPMGRPLGIAIAVLLAGAAGAPVALAQTDPYAAVDACLQAEMQAKRIPGASIAIALDGRMVHANAFGVRRAGEPAPIDTETLFRINSTTKMMTAAAIMREVEAGRLDLRAPLTVYLPDLSFRAPWSARDLTLHTLLANAGGLPDPYLDFSRMPREYVLADADVDLSAWARSLKTMHLLAPPGSFWNYSSPNFSLAAVALEAITGSSYADYVTDALWRPAGMSVTTFDPEVVVASGNYAVGHVGGAFWGEPGSYQRAHALPGGGAYSTPTELVRWALQLASDGGAILSPASVRAMTTPYYIADGDVPWSPRTRYGYGIFIDDYRKIDDRSRVVRVLRHPGNGRGYGTELVWAPELGFVVTTLINDHNNMLQSVDCALRQVAGLEPVPLVGRDTPASRWGRYTGTYAITDLYGHRWTARVALRDGQLDMRHPDWMLAPHIRQAYPEGAPMRALYYDTFRYNYAGGDQTITFESGRAPDAPGVGTAPIGWLRNRYFVGRRVGELPEALTITGRDCTRLALTAGQDTPALTVRTHGLSPVRTWRGLAVTQDDPDDPASSGVRLDLDLDGPLGYLTAWRFAEANRTIGMYLMQDMDGDGRYAWPDELVERLTSDAAQGMDVPARATSGAYQLWLHGAKVPGGSTTIDLDVVAVAGDALRAVGVPASLGEGERAAFDVCVDPGPHDDGSRVGIVELDFGAPGAVARVPVYWSIGDGRAQPMAPLCLPWLGR